MRDQFIINREEVERATEGSQGSMLRRLPSSYLRRIGRCLYIYERHGSRQRDSETLRVGKRGGWGWQCCQYGRVTHTHTHRHTHRQTHTHTHTHTCTHTAQEWKRMQNAPRDGDSHVRHQAALLPGWQRGPHIRADLLRTNRRAEPRTLCSNCCTLNVLWPGRASVLCISHRSSGACSHLLTDMAHSFSICSTVIQPAFYSKGKHPR